MQEFEQELHVKEPERKLKFFVYGRKGYSFLNRRGYDIERFFVEPLLRLRPVVFLKRPLLSRRRRVAMISSVSFSAAHSEGNRDDRDRRYGVRPTIPPPKWPRGVITILITVRRGSRRRGAGR